MQSLQQLLWTAAPSLGPGRCRGIWVMANGAPARCGDLVMADQLRVSMADRGGGSVRENPLRSQADDGHRALAGHRLLCMLLYGGEV